MGLGELIMLGVAFGSASFFGLSINMLHSVVLNTRNKVTQVDHAKAIA